MTSIHFLFILYACFTNAIHEARWASSFISNATIMTSIHYQNFRIQSNHKIKLMRKRKLQ
jgi:hypothetical protein